MIEKNCQKGCKPQNLMCVVCFTSNSLSRPTIPRKPLSFNSRRKSSRRRSARARQIFLLASASTFQIRFFQPLSILLHNCKPKHTDATYLDIKSPGHVILSQRHHRIHRQKGRTSLQRWSFISMFENMILTVPLSAQPFSSSSEKEDSGKGWTSKGFHRRKAG